LVDFSDMALYYKTRPGGWIQLCDNDCGAWVYKDLSDGKIRNAEKSKKDSEHWGTCSTLQHVWMIASGLNWFPSFSFLKEVEKIIEAAKELEKKINARKEHNILAREEWEEWKRQKRTKKREERKLKGLAV
jgi:hypothetical protein